GARARPVKKVLLDGLRPVTSYQRVFNSRVLEALGTIAGLVRAQGSELHTLEPRLNRMNAAIATIDVAIDEVSEQVRDLEDRFAAVEAVSEGADRLDPMGRRIELQSLLSRIQVLEAKIGRVRRSAESSAAADDGAGAGAARVAENTTAAMRAIDVGFDSDDARLYADLEDTFRGSRADVRALLEPYVVDVEAIGSTATVIDIGCGRGEWLEILRDHDVPAYGLDLNPLTVADCTERGLDAREGDAVAHLRDLPDDSVAAVTGFHIAEHLPLRDLLDLIEAALVALVPGGVLILETPNCTNLTVGASSFYLDPTHVKPLHPQLLEFLCRQRGFDAVEVRYLHPRKATQSERTLATQRGSLPPGMLEEINWALFGPMDYAVIATKAEAG
ncbi:MAG TPA: methyltransferase domain-containing protein, partial [Acidimicrobiales bacterium]|nr:methyltransferase domain-containing protein [Acidimicrobiales bacterium]